MRPKCKICLVNVTRVLPSGNYRSKCRTCTGRGGKIAYRRLKKTYCENESCPLAGTEYESYILDVDHSDGNKYNNDPTNLVTLCCVCHRRKTHNARDFVSINYRETQ
jgi:hypothetical protein